MTAKILNLIGLDGFAHILVSLVIVLALQIVIPFWIAILVSLLIGIAKELIWDLWLKKGTPQWKDIICDLVGILISCMAIF